MIILYVLMALIYFNQGFSGLPSLCTFFLLKDQWGLDVTRIALLSTICTIPWIIKPVYGFVGDLFPLFSYRRKSYLLINYLLIILVGFYIFLFGFTLTSYIILNILLGFCFASSDVHADGIMVEVGQKHNLLGKIQAVQWGAVSTALVLVGILGGLLAKYSTYQYAYAYSMFLPLLTFVFLLKYYKEDKRKEKVNLEYFKAVRLALKNKQLWLGISFLFLLYFSPSFGTALTFKMVDILKFDKVFLGILSSVGSTAGIVGAVVYFLICKKWNIKKLLFWTTLISGLTTFAYLYFPNKEIAITYGVIFGLFGMISHLAILEFCAKITPLNAEASTFALIMSVLNLGSMGSTALGGFLYKFVGLEVLIVISGMTTLFCLPLLKFIRVGREKLK